MHILLIILIAIFALVGFCISSYIFQKKKTKKKLICPRYSNCDAVIHSDYSTIGGIRIEILGMLYYFFIGSAYTWAFVLSWWSSSLGIVLFSVSFFAVLFSFYLVSMQAFVIKQWCAWCLCSAGLSVLIFVASYIHLLTY